MKHERCPECDERGRRVGRVTLENQLTPEAVGRLPDGDFRFCATANCPAVYFHEQRRVTFFVRHLTRDVFQKQDARARLVCYCFGHSVADLEEELQRSGQSHIEASIREACGQGLDDCPRNNPQGACCLGNIRRVIRAASSQEVKEASDACPCCPSTKEPQR